MSRPATTPTSAAHDRDLRWRGPLAGRYPAAAAMVMSALIPYLALSAAIGPITPIIAHGLHMSLQEMSLASGMGNAAYAVGTVLAVQFAQLLHQRRMMVLYVGLLVVGSVLEAAAQDPAMFITGHVLQGLCTSLLLIAAVPPLALGFGIISVACVLAIPREQIDDRSARGLRTLGKSQDSASGLSVLFKRRALLALAATLAIFSLGNGAMLSMYSLAVVQAKQANPAAFVAASVVISQGTMVFASLLAMRIIGRHGYWPVILVSMLVLPVRAAIAPFLIKSWGVVPMQILDGITSGLQTVAVPGLVARILNGTGRINVGQGVVLTVQGIGGALSPAVGGWIAEWRGFGVSFLALGGCGIISTVLWITFASTVRRTRAWAKQSRPLRSQEARCE